MLKSAHKLPSTLSASLHYLTALIEGKKEAITQFIEMQFLGESKSSEVFM